VPPGGIPPAVGCPCGGTPDGELSPPPRCEGTGEPGSPVRGVAVGARPLADVVLSPGRDVVLSPVWDGLSDLGAGEPSPACVGELRWLGASLLARAGLGELSPTCVGEPLPAWLGESPLCAGLGELSPGWLGESLPARVGVGDPPSPV
jgi:hypothetical protein